jgi:hypothetical protein
MQFNFMEVGMNTQKFLATVALVVCAMVCAQAQELVLPANADRTRIEDNLLVGLTSENTGLQRSCALMLGKMKSSRAVIPLMATLRDGQTLELKTAAAWALCNIGDARGTFAVKREVLFNNCCMTKLRCAWYYENMVHSGTFWFKNLSPDVIAIVQQQP